MSACSFLNAASSRSRDRSRLRENRADLVARLASLDRGLGFLLDCPQRRDIGGGRLHEGVVERRDRRLLLDRELERVRQKLSRADSRRVDRRRRAHGVVGNEVDDVARPWSPATPASRLVARRKQRDRVQAARTKRARMTTLLSGAWSAAIRWDQAHDAGSSDARLQARTHAARRCRTSAASAVVNRKKAGPIGPASFVHERSRRCQRIRMLLPIAAPRATRPAAAASATTGETWIDFFHHGSAICGTSAGSAAMICAFTCAGVTR